jgi:dihydrolipoamide dehydrogenase
VAVVGAGPGGYAAAFRAADLGLGVTLIDPEEHPGGVCLYRGCIPSKALLHVARVLAEAEELAGCGVGFEPPRIDVGTLRGWKSSVVKRLTSGLSALGKARGVRFVRGRAAFRDASSLQIELIEPGRLEVRARYTVVATGSRPGSLPIDVPDSERIMNSTAALELPSVPPTLLVVGGGYIGLELASVYAALGSRVTLVEMTEGLLPGADRDLVRVLQRRLTGRLEAVHCETKLEALEEAEDAIVARLATKRAAPVDRRFSHVLIAVGRKPNTSGLGLANTKVEVGQKGFIVADGERRTAESAVFAVGDVAGEPMLAHKATHEGTTVAEILAGKRRTFEPAAIPAVVYTDPEIAWCGLTEAEAARTGRAVTVTRFPWQASGRAMTVGRTDGLTKLVVDPETERILGAGIVGVGAGDLIAEMVLAIETGAVVEDVSASIHPHPTLSETVMEAADMLHGLSVHVQRTRRSTE